MALLPPLPRSHLLPLSLYPGTLAPFLLNFEFCSHSAWLELESPGETSLAWSLCFVDGEMDGERDLPPTTQQVNSGTAENGTGGAFSIAGLRGPICGSPEVQTHASARKAW